MPINSARMQSFQPASAKRGAQLDFGAGYYALDGVKYDSFLDLPGAVFTGPAQGTAEKLDGSIVMFNSRVNECLNTVNFSAAQWISTGLTITGSTADPKGGTNATCLTATSNLASIYQSFNLFGTYASSIYIRRKTGTGDVFWLRPNGSQEKLTLTTSWQRIQSSSLNNPIIGITIATSGDEVCVYAPQMELGDRATSHIPNTTSASISQATPRITDKGILIEGSKTNSLMNSMMVGAAVGTQPTGWASFQAASGLTQTISGVGYENGLPYLDYTIQGITNGTVFPAIYMTGIGTNGIPITNGTSFSQSVYTRIISGSLPGTFQHLTQIFNGGGSYLSSMLGSSLSPSTTITRNTASATVSNASTAYMAYALTSTISGGVTVDVTIRIYGPQIELGSTIVSSFIPTYGAASTRAVDAAYINMSTLASGTIYADYIPLMSLSQRAVFALNDNTANNRIDVRNNSGNHTTNISTAGVAQLNFGNADTITINENHRIAMSFDATARCEFYHDGKLVSTGTNAIIPTFTRFQVGMIDGGINHLYGYINKLGLYSRVLPSNEMRALTVLGSPTIDLRFADGRYIFNGNEYASIDKIPGWTYTGGTPAGIGTYAERSSTRTSRTNLATYSQAFDDASWGKTRSTIAANTVVVKDPIGTYTADKLLEDTSTGTHLLAKAITVTTNTVYTFSAYFKAAERTYAALYDGARGVGKFFNLSNGTVGGNLIGAPDNATITNVGNGWYRCSITLRTASTSFNASVYTSTDGTTFSYTGADTSGIYVWGAQLELGTAPTVYLPTTATAVTDYDTAGLQFFPTITNQLIRSQEFSDAAWSKSNLTSVTDNAAIAPNGTLTASVVTENTASTNHCLYGTGVSLTGGATYTASVYVKGGTLRYVSVRGEAVGAGGTLYAWVTLDTQTGTVNANANALNAKATAEANGYYRVSFSWVNYSGSGGQNIVIAGSNVSTAPLGSNVLGNTYTGTSATFYIWGAQIQLGSSVSTYVPTTTATVTLATPRITDAGYLAEEARTNSIPRTNTTGAVVGVIGSGGALPTGWSPVTPSGLTTTVVSIGDGAYGPYVDVRVSGTNSTGSTAYPGFSFSGGQSIAATSGQTWAMSFYVALIAGSATGVTNFIVNSVENAAGGSYVTSQGLNYNPTSVPTRQVYVRTLNGGGTTAYAYTGAYTVLAAGATVDYTLRISLPQMELGAFATSPIPTSSGPVTRNVDAGYVSGLSVSMASVAVLASFDILSPNGLDIRPANLSDGTNNNRITVSRAASDQGSIFATAGGVYQGGTSSGVLYQIGSKVTFIATIRGTAAINGGFNGVAGTDYGPIVVPANANMLNIGTGQGTSLPINGPVRRVAVYPRSLNNTELTYIST